MNRRQLLASAPALFVLPIAGCALFGNQSGDAAVQSIYSQTIAAQLAAGVLFHAGEALVDTGVIKLGSATHDDANAAFQALAGAADSLNTDIQAGIPSPVQALLSAALAALAAAQAALTKAKPTVAQGQALMANRPAAPMAAFGVSEILALVVQLLPIIIQVGGQVAALVQSLIASLSAPKNGVVLTIADVANANASMHTGLMAWSTAQPA